MENLEPKYDERKGCGCTLAFLSITAIIISVLALALVDPRTLKMNEWGEIDRGIDYLGIIIGILALMVTLMVGWNIWQTMEARRAIERFDDKTNNYDIDLDKKVKSIKDELLAEIKNLQDNTSEELINKESYARGRTASDIYEKLVYSYSLLNRLDNQPFSPFENTLYNFLFHSIQGLWHEANKGDIANCKSIISSMNRWVDDAKNMTLSEEQAQSIHKELNKIEPKIKSLKSFGEFKTKFAELYPPF